MTRSEGFVVAMFGVVLAAWLIVHGLHGRKAVALPGNAATPVR